MEIHSDHQDTGGKKTQFVVLSTPCVNDSTAVDLFFLNNDCTRTLILKRTESFEVKLVIYLVCLSKGGVLINTLIC